MKSKWKLIIMVLIVAAVGLFAWMKVSDNLSTYSVYYATRTEGLYSPLQEAMRNFNDIDHPELENYKYKRDNLSWDWEFATQYRGVKVRYIVIGNVRMFYFGDEDTFYSLNKTGDIKYKYGNQSGQSNVLKRNISNEEQKSVDEALSAIFNPIIQAQPAPNWNLQWLYNLLNQRR